MKDKISIIVPVFNVELYLSKCIESILNQKYNNIEVLLINDGSTDNSGEICDKFANKDNRIKVIHKKNEGVSIARNIGLKYSTGEYIAFVDGDDFVNENIYTTLYSRINNSRFDLVMCRFYRSFSNGENIVENEPLREGEYLKDNIYKELILPMIGNDFDNMGKSLIMGTTWRCLYKKEIIKKNRIEFPIIKIAEDMIFNLNYLAYCNYVYIEKEPLYYYRYNYNSATKKYITNLWDTLSKQLNIVNNDLKKFKMLNENSKERLASNTFYYISWSFTNECHPYNVKKYMDIVEEMNRISKTEHFKNVFTWKNIIKSPFKERCLFICIKLKLYRIFYTYNNKKIKVTNLSNEVTYE